MPKKRKTTTKARVSSVKVKGRRASSRIQGRDVTKTIGRFILPLLIIIVLSGCLAFLGISGYRTATASGFFGIRNIEVVGVERSSIDDIRRIVSSSVERPGVWNADLGDIRAKIEKFPFVRSASVSMVLPAGVRVNVIERVPAAIVRLNAGTFLVDNEGAILAAATPNDQDFPFVLLGWDESKTEKAIPDNIARLKVYKKMLDEWRQFGLVTRVKEVNLANPREPVAVVEDSGHPIAVTLAKDSLGKSLKTAIDALSGKGAKIRSVDAEGIYPVIQYLEF